MTKNNTIWKSALDALQVFSGSNTLKFPSIVGDSILAISVLSESDGRHTLIKMSENSADTTLSPRSMDLLSKVNGYAGRPYWINRAEKNRIYFANASDQHVYRLNIPSKAVDQAEPERVTPRQPQGSLAMYANLNFIGKTHALAVTEIENSQFLSHSKNGQQTENQTLITSIDLGNNNAPLKPLVTGHDFYSNLVVNDAQDKAAWVSWNHPHMPWNDTEVWAADIVDIKGDISLVNHTRLFADQAGCYCQLTFSKDNKLFFAADFSQATQSSQNFWNIYCYDFANESGAIQVSYLHTEFGGPHWIYGDHRLVVFDDEHIAAIAMNRENADLYLINTKDFSCERICEDDHILQMMCSNNAGRLGFVHTDKTRLESIAEYSIETGLIKPAGVPAGLTIDNISTATHIEFTSNNKENAYGFFYPATNSAYTQTEPSPLIVMVHGGPTSRAYNQFDLQKQFWTNRGFAVFDVNHRGSTGYGRSFRDALYGEWGCHDAQDIKHGIEHLIKAEKADADRIFIRGKSAGGFAVLRSLTEFPELFCAGASYYGIGNLATLTNATHKFERYYVDTLLQEPYNQQHSQTPESKYFTRSPINFLDQLNCAMILFQGENDKVVPPEVSREVVEILKAKNIDHQYIEFPGEGHGFRKLENNIHALESELAFYLRAMKKASSNTVV